MSDLIKALYIFLKYKDSRFPTHCSHDELWVDVNPLDVTTDDIINLDKLGFFPNEEGFSSYRFGSC